MKITIYQTDVLQALKQIPSESIDMQITSPPYWGLRDYGIEPSIWDADENCEHTWEDRTYRIGNRAGNKDKETNEAFTKRNNYSEQFKATNPTSQFCVKCNAWKGQLGLEPTFDLYIKHLCNIFDEVKRVLKKIGTCWVNLGDTYGGLGHSDWSSSNPEITKKYSKLNQNKDFKLKKNFPEKSLCMIPMRFAIEMVNRGWILRNDICWYKRNSMPSSVKDRFANKWEHVFLFSKSKKYYFDMDAVRKPHLQTSINPINAGFSDRVAFNDRVRESLKGTLEPKFGSKYSATEEEKLEYNNKYPYSVQLREKEFVEYRNLPNIEELSKKLNEERIRLGFTIEDIELNLDSQAPHHWFNGESFPSVSDWYRLKEIGFKLLEFDKQMTEIFTKSSEKQNNPLGGNPGDFWDITTQPHPFAHFACYPERLCEIPIKSGCPKNGIVLDPFAGSGTTCLAARKLSRSFIGFELNPSYIEIANNRLKPYLQQTKLMEVN